MNENKEIGVLREIVVALVDNSEAVKIERTTDEMGVLLALHVAPEDMGKVIGREGITAKAIRTILRSVGAKHNARINLKIVEPEGSQRPVRSNYEETRDRDLIGG